MKRLRLYKNNRIDKEYTVDFKHIITDYINSDYQKADLPFERKFLHYLSEKYSDSSYEPFDQKQWEYIYSIYRKLIN